MKIKSCVGGHPIRIYIDCIFDEKIRKYRPGKLLTEIPFSGEMLSVDYKLNDGSLNYDDGKIPVYTPQIMSVDSPAADEQYDYIIVSAQYVSACKQIGYPTERLLTISTPVVDENGHVIGTIGLNRN